MRLRSVGTVLLIGVLLMPAAAFAGSQPQQAQEQEQVTERVYGWELMSDQERREHRMKMQSLKTQEERERYRLEHHKKMQQRAREMGVELPDEPMPYGKGMGAGPQGGGRQ